MWHFFDHEGKKEWIYVLESLVQGVNQSINRTIGVAPKDVTKENEDLVFTKLYGHSHKIRWPTYKVGDLVLLSKYASPLGDQSKKLFKKGTRQTLQKRALLFPRWIVEIQTFTPLWTRRATMNQFWVGSIHKS